MLILKLPSRLWGNPDIHWTPVSKLLRFQMVYQPSSSGKIDEVVAEINQAREGGLSGGLNPGSGSAGAKLEGGRKSTMAFEEEVVRTRTRFSIFEIWY